MQRNYPGEQTITVRGNLREQVAWTGALKEDGSVDDFLQEMGTITRMAVTRAQKTELPVPYQMETICKKILVMGWRYCRHHRSQGAAAAGYEVSIGRREFNPGGKALGWRKMFPTAYPYSELEMA